MNEKGKEKTTEKGKAAQAFFSMQMKNMSRKRRTVHFIVREEWLYLQLSRDMSNPFSEAQSEYIHLRAQSRKLHMQMKGLNPAPVKMKFIYAFSHPFMHAYCT